MRSLFKNIIPFSFLSLVACVDDPEIPPSTLGFPDITYYSEFDGTFYVPVGLDQPQFGYCNFKVEPFFANALTNNTDFGSIYTASPFTILGSEKTINVSGIIRDDTLKDGNDTLRFNLTELSSNIKLSSRPEQATGTLVVIDDDNIPADEMLIQLKWAATGAKINKIDADFDLSLVTDAELDTDESLIGWSEVKISRKTTTFEQITIDEDLADKEYYIVLEYINRTRNVTGVVNPTLKITGFGFSDWKGSNTWRWAFQKDDIDYYGWVGPFKKTGRTFTPMFE